MNQSAPKDQPAYLVRLCAERHSHADFLSTLCHGIGSDGEQSHGRQHDGDTREDRKHRPEHAGEPANLCQVLIHCTDVVQRQVWIQGEHLLSKTWCQGSWIQPRPHDDRCRADKTRILAVRNVRNRIRCEVVLGATLADIRHETDDRRPFGLCRARSIFDQTDSLPDWLLVWKVHGSEALIDHGYLSTGSSLDHIECAAAREIHTDCVKVPRPDVQHRYQLGLVALRLRLTVDYQLSSSAAEQRKAVCDTCANHSIDCVQPF